VLSFYLLFMCLTPHLYPLTGYGPIPSLRHRFTTSTYTRELISIMSIVTATKDCATAKLIDSLKDLEDDGSNFSTWKYLQLEVFKYQGLDGYINGSEKKPNDSDTAELQKWKKNMRTACLQITMHVGPDVL
jgi:hypothetical protein